MSLGILDGIVQTFELATQTWFSTLFPIAQNLFFALMVIQIGPRFEQQLNAGETVERLYAAFVQDG